MLNIGKMFFIISLSDSNCCRCISKKCSSKISSFNHARMAWLPGRSRSLKKAGVYFSPEVIEKARMELDTHSHIFVGSTSFLRPFAFLKQWSLLVFKSCLSKGSTRMNKNVRHLSTYFLNRTMELHLNEDEASVVPVIHACIRTWVDFCIIKGLRFLIVFLDAMNVIREVGKANSRDA